MSITDQIFSTTTTTAITLYSTWWNECRRVKLQRLVRGPSNKEKLRQSNYRTSPLWQLGWWRKGAREHLFMCAFARVSVHVRMCVYVGTLWCWVKEVCFFPPWGASGWGRARRSFGEAQHGAGCFSWTQCTVTALGAGGHRVQHSSRALSVYTTAAGLGGGGSSA